MYPNLKAEMSRNSINNSMIAECLEQNPSTISAKLNNYNRIKLSEAVKIRDKFFPTLGIDYLFSSEKIVDKAS